jgi:hypothetical protein
MISPAPGLAMTVNQAVRLEVKWHELARGLVLAAKPGRRIEALIGWPTMAAFSLAGNTVLAVQPMVVGGLVDLLHFSQSQAGFVAAAELLGFSLGGTALLFFVSKVDRRVLTLVGVGIAVSADVAACMVRAFPPMLLLLLSIKELVRTHPDAPTRRNN